MKIDGKTRATNKRKYCLACSPFGSHNTRRLDGSLTKRHELDEGYDEKAMSRANELYQSGLSLKLVAKTMGISALTVLKWSKMKKIKTRTLKEARGVAIAAGRLTDPSQWSEERREIARQQTKARYELDPSRHPNRLLANNRSKMSRPERLVFDLLTAEGIPFEHGKSLCGFYPDFIIGKTLIEVDGARWHTPERDVPRDKVLTDAGYTVHRFPAKLVMKDPRVVLSCLTLSRV